ncbi:MAG: glycosyltransferase family 2 protein [Bacteroidaceae bacterium]|nr:glycosyltransferase family 2 protein [Bacteroidaceae bacterium]
MANPLVSVLVPVYQAEKYIERCAQSLFEQTYDNMEFIFCDDCSPDASIQKLKEVMKDYPQRSEQIRIIHHERNRGSAAARNTLIDNCKGVFLFWVDSDDWVDTNAVEVLVKKQQETDADIVTCRAYAHFARGEVREYFDGGWDLDRETLLEMILRGKRGASVWRRLIRRELFTVNHIKCIEGINGRDDFQLIVPLIYFSRKVDGINAFLYHYRRDISHSITYDYMNNVTYQIHAMISRLAMRDFFAGKDDHYVHIISEEIVRWAHKFMMQHYQHHNRKSYQIMVDYIDQMEREYWKKIKWDNEIIRCMEHNYYIMCVTYPIRRLRRKINCH